MTDFDFPMVRNDDPETSHAAAAKVRPHIGKGMLTALKALATVPDATDHELMDLTGRQHNSIGKRRLDCQRMGWIEFTGTTRPGHTDTDMMVWRITPAGREYLAGQA